MYGYKMTAMTGYTVGYCHACITHLIGLCVRNNVFLFLYSASENIHHPLIETEEIMDLTIFATLLRLHQFISFASFLYGCHLHTNQVSLRLHGLQFVV